MTILEIKLRMTSGEYVKEILNSIEARYLRTEQQTDTYFKVSNGRLKLREVQGADTMLIQYFRKKNQFPAQCHYAVARVAKADKFGSMLKRIHGILVRVQKKREYWAWNNIKIHLDWIQELGCFLELEAHAENAEEHLKIEDQFIFLMTRFSIEPGNVMRRDYVELMQES